MKSYRNKFVSAVRLHLIRAGIVTEGVESFFLNLSGATGATISDAQGVGTITRQAVGSLVSALAHALAGTDVTSTGNITPSLTTSRTSGVAPCAIFFDATSTTNSLSVDSFTDILYIHNFGDGSAGSWTYGTTTSTKNVARGAVAAHVYETPGTYTHRVTALYVSNTGVLSVGGTVSTTITVTDPDTVYSGANTICVANGAAPVPGVNGVPLGATCVGGITSVTAAMTQAGINSGSGTANKRLLFKCGDTFDVTVDDYIRKSGGIVGSFGSGVKPVIEVSTNNRAFYLLYASNWTFMDLKFTNAGFSKLCLGTQDSSGTNILMLRLEAAGTGGMEPSGDGVFMVDCNLHELTGGSGFVGFYSQIGSRIVAMGNRIYDCSGIEHNIRFQGCTKIVISNNTLYQQAVSKHLITIRGRSMQALGGSIATWSGVWCEHVIISDNDLDSGSNSGWANHLGAQNPGADERTRNVLFERNYMHGNCSVALMTEALTGVIIRNNIIREEFVGTYSDASILIVGRSSIGMAPPSDTRIYNNTIYQTNGAHTAFEAIGIAKDNTSALPTGTVAKNNLVYAPGATTNDYNSGVSGPMFIECSPNGGTTWIASSNSSDSQIKNTAPGFTVPPVTLTDWKITSGYSVDGGEFVPVFDDFAGVARTGAMDIGAY